MTTGKGRRTGLKYESIPIVFDEFGVTKKQRAEVMGALRVMEQEALQVFNHD